MTHRIGYPRLMVALVAALLTIGAAPALPIAASTPVGVDAREIAVTVGRSSTIRLPLLASHIAVHWRGNPEAHVSVALSADGTTFGPSIDLETIDKRDARQTETFSGVIWTGGARAVRIASDVSIGRATVVSIDAHTSARSTRTNPYVAAAAVEQPGVVSRAAWGADESLRHDAAGNELWPPEFYPVQKLIVHHTAGRNGDPDPAATVRAIYYYHAVTQGWGDVGYNFLIDESGRIYEGRYSRAYTSGETPSGEDLNGNGVTGAHVQGYNSGSVGIAFLGTLTNQDATPAARDALKRLLAWKADRHGIDPMGSALYTNPVNGTQRTFANIAGHRDLAATECPGGTFYSTLPQLRRDVSTMVTGTTPETTVPGAAVLTARTAPAGKGVRLDWTAPTDGGSPITEYRVLRRNAGVFTRIATVTASARSYVDRSAKRGVTYTYVVRAVNSLGVGPYSNEASAVAR
jgi:hypothetical protein